jgi:quercetin dioxygenase-like cupin family protein
MAVTQISGTYKFSYNNSEITMYKANCGEGLQKHEHTIPHLTICLSGQICVRTENEKLFMDSTSEPIILKANSWHEIEAVEDNSSFLNIV